MVLIPLPPTMSSQGGRAHLIEMSLLMLVQEVRASYLTLGVLLSLEYDNHCRQRLDCLRDVLECLQIEQDTELLEGVDDEGGGGIRFMTLPFWTCWNQTLPYPPPRYGWDIIGTGGGG